MTNDSLKKTKEKEEKILTEKRKAQDKELEEYFKTIAEVSKEQIKSVRDGVQTQQREAARQTTEARKAIVEKGAGEAGAVSANN